MTVVYSTISNVKRTTTCVCDKPKFVIPITIGMVHIAVKDRLRRRTICIIYILRTKGERHLNRSAPISRQRTEWSRISAESETIIRLTNIQSFFSSVQFSSAASTVCYCLEMRVLGVALVGKTVNSSSHSHTHIHTEIHATYATYWFTKRGKFICANN